MSTQNQIKDQVKAYINEATFTEGDKIKDDTLIFKEGYFDSMGFVSLISFIEETFGVETDDEDLIEENFESVNAITSYVERKTVKAA